MVELVCVYVYPRVWNKETDKNLHGWSSGHQRRTRKAAQPCIKEWVRRPTFFPAVEIYISGGMNRTGQKNGSWRVPKGDGAEMDRSYLDQVLLMYESAKSLNDRMIYMGSADQPERPKHAPVNHKLEWSWCRRLGKVGTHPSHRDCHSLFAM